MSRMYSFSVVHILLYSVILVVRYSRWRRIVSIKHFFCSKSRCSRTGKFFILFSTGFGVFCAICRSREIRVCQIYCMEGLCRKTNSQPTFMYFGNRKTSEPAGLVTGQNVSRRNFIFPRARWVYDVHMYVRRALGMRGLGGWC
jgi:hypothetical protein